MNFNFKYLVFVSTHKGVLQLHSFWTFSNFLRLVAIERNYEDTNHCRGTIFFFGLILLANLSLHHFLQLELGLEQNEKSRLDPEQNIPIASDLFVTSKNEFSNSRI